MPDQTIPFNGNVQLIRRKNAFTPTDCDVRIIEAGGQSLEELFTEYMPAGMDCTCSLSGELIPREDWPLTFVGPTDSVLFTPIISGGGGGDKAILGMLLIIVAVVAWYAAPQLLGAMAEFGVAGLGGNAAALMAVQAGAFAIGAMGGAILMGAMFGMPQIETPGTQASITSWSPQTTQEQGGCIPRYYGTVKVVGNIIASNIENVSEKQFLYALVCLGIGPYKRVHDITINKIASHNLKDATITMRLGYLEQDVMPGFEDTSINVSDSQKLLYNVPKLISTGYTEFNKLIVQLLFPYGLGYANDKGGLDTVSVNFQVKIKRPTDVEWTIVTRTEYTTDETIIVPGWALVSSTAVQQHYEYSEYGEFIVVTPSTPTVLFEDTSAAFEDHIEGEVGMTLKTFILEGSPPTEYDGKVFGVWAWQPITKNVTAWNDYWTQTAASRNRIPVDILFDVPKDFEGQYDISVTRMSPDNEDVRVLDDIYYVGHSEVLYDEYTYPRHVLVGAHMLATDQISGSFSFSCITDAAYVHVYDASTQTWSIVWSDNPAWVCYDVLTSPLFDDGLTTVLRYDGITPERVNLNDFVEWAAFCDTLLLQAHSQTCVLGSDALMYLCTKDHMASDINKPQAGNSYWSDFWTTTATGTPETWTSGMRYYRGVEKRYTFNGGFDTRSSRWDAALQIATVSQAALMIVGTQIRVIIDTIKMPTQLITEGNLKDFKEKFLDLTNRATEVDADFKNAEMDYAPDRVTAFLSNSPDMYGKAEVNTSGLTKKTEVWRLAKYHLVQNQRRRIVEGELDIDSINCMVGDVIYLQSETPEWDSRGGNVMAATSSTITLDREVEIVSGVTYTVLVRLSATDEVVTKQIAASMVPGVYSTLTIVGTYAPPIPAFGDIFAFGEINKTAKTMSIINISPNTHHGATLTMIEYDADLYAQVDAMTPEVNIGVDVIRTPYVKIEELVLSENAAFDLNGNIVRTISASWSAGVTGTAYDRGRITYMYQDKNSGLIVTPMQTIDGIRELSCTIPNVIPEAYYVVKIFGIDVTGNIPPDGNENMKTAMITTTFMLPPIPENEEYLTSVASDGGILFAWALMNRLSFGSYKVRAGIRWQASSVYAAGERIVPADGTRQRFICTTAGTSGASAPVWPASGTIADGSVVWTEDSAAWEYTTVIQPEYRYYVTAADKIKDGRSNAVVTLWVVGVDKSGTMSSAVPSSTSFTILRPSAPSVTSMLIRTNVRLSWDDCRTSFPVDHYIIDSDPVGYVYSYQLPVTWSGNRTFVVLAIDIFGNLSEPGSCLVNIDGLPSTVSFSTSGGVYCINIIIASTIDPFCSVEIWAAETNDRALAAKVGESFAQQWAHTGLGLVAVRYYWIRFKDEFGNIGDWWPSGQTAGIYGQTSDDPAQYMEILDDSITESKLTESLRTRIDFIDTELFALDPEIVEENIVSGLVGAFSGLLTLTSTHNGDILDLFDLDTALTARVSTAEVTISAQEGAILLRATTTELSAVSADLDIAEIDIDNLGISLSDEHARVTALDTRVGIAEVNIQGGINGTWPSITSKVGYAEFNGLSDQVAAAETSISILETDTGDMAAQYTVKLNVNGFIAGIGLLLAGTTSSFIVMADSFAVVKPGSTTDIKAPFIVGNISGVSTVGINGNLVIDGSILARHIATGQLVVGTNVTMGPGATITWANVTSAPTIPTNTTQLTDGAGLGTTATWNSVTGSGKPANNADVTISAVNGGLYISGGGITMSGGGAIKGGQSSYNVGSGYFLGYESGYKFSIGNPSGKSLTWNGSALAINGELVYEGNIGAGAVSNSQSVVTSAAFEVYSNGQYYNGGVAQTLTVVTTGRPVILFAKVTTYASGPGFMIYIKRGSTTLYSAGGITNLNFSYIDSPSAGTHTYTISVVKDGGDEGSIYVSNRGLATMELKK